LLIIVGYIFKALLTQYVLKVLNSLLKNITEVLGMMGTYFERLIFFKNAHFQLSSFVAACQVLIAVCIYVGTKWERIKRQKEVDRLKGMIGYNMEKTPEYKPPRVASAPPINELKEGLLDSKDPIHKV